MIVDKNVWMQYNEKYCLIKVKPHQKVRDVQGVLERMVDDVASKPQKPEAVLDLANVGLLTSMDLTAIIDLYQRAKHAGLGFVVVNPSVYAKNIICTTGLHKRINVYDTLNDYLIAKTQQYGKTKT